MRKLAALPLAFACVAFAAAGVAQPPPATAPPAPASSAASSAAPAPPAAPPAPAAPASSAASEPSRGDGMRAYHAALQSRRLGQTELRLEDVRARVAEAEELAGVGRTDEAIGRLTEMVEH